MTTTQAAEYVGLDPSRIRQEVRAGRLRAERQDTPRGPILWFLPSELDRWKGEREKLAAERTGKRGRPLKGVPRPDKEEGTPDA